MKKPTYKHPDFVIKTEDRRIENQNKRLWLSLQIDKDAPESLLIILKNPSRATKDISDKTVFTISNYVHKNKDKYPEFKNVGKLIIANLIPFYETYSYQLATSDLKLFDKDNGDTLSELTSKHNNVIIAWGNHPRGLKKEYEILKQSAFDILQANNNNVFYVDKLTKSGNPKHGQVWGYQNELIKYSFDGTIK